MFPSNQLIVTVGDSGLFIVSLLVRLSVASSNYMYLLACLCISLCFLSTNESTNKEANLPHDTIRFLFPESSASKLRALEIREARSRGEGAAREEARKLIEIRVSGRKTNSSGEKPSTPYKTSPLWLVLRAKDFWLTQILLLKG